MPERAAPMTIRVETAADRPGIRQVHEEAFGRVNEADLVDALRLTEGFVPELSLVAEQESRIVGHVLFTIAQVVEGDRRNAVLALAPLGVLPSHQRQGVGSRLTEQGLAHARQRGFKNVIVLGHPGYYPRFGFLPAERFGVLPPWGTPSPALMALPLVPDGLANVHGRVVYPPPFDGV